MDNSVYWIWLQQAIGYASHKVKVVFEIYEGNIKEFYNSGEYAWRLCGCFTNKQIESLRTTPLEKAESIFKKCQSLGYDVISIENESYPKLLREIADPPAVLYAFGDKSCFDSNVFISIIGARGATPSGIRTAKQMAYQIALDSGVIVSGGARGIDSAAHVGAIEAGMKTVAVLGSGINTEYLVANRALREKIAESGILISEYPPDFPAYPRNFPLRNRIISGLSQATIIVEAGKKSGSLITANCAGEQGRDVFVAPIDLESPLSAGIVSLIDDGVKVIADVKGMVQSYESKLSFGAKTKTDLNFFKNFLKENSQSGQAALPLPDEEKPEPKLSLVSENAKKVYDVLGSGGMHVNAIYEKSGLEMRHILSSLTELEIYGLIKNTTGRVYEKTKN